MKTHLNWSTRNSKIKKTNTVAFSLPAIAACPQAGICASVCYATQGRYIMRNVIKTRESNFDKARSPEFETMLREDLGKLGKFGSVRIHDSGDFFNQEYLNTWAQIATENPTKIFYAYTKSLHLDFSKLPKNFHVIQSQGGKLDHAIDLEKPHSRIFSSHEARKRAGYVDGNIDDSPAITGETKIGLVYHGQKKLTENQLTVFA